MFSLPPQLPSPTHNLTATSNYVSDTATIPYPTHAAIETPQSSLSRGDWGLKRPLPLKSTMSTSTPSIRVDAVDSIDHITDFKSSADHVLTLRKFQEMGLPISMPEASRRRGASNINTVWLGPPRSVFEADVDNREAIPQNTSKDQQRWKYKGPWLPGQTYGEFEEYINKEIKRRKFEFQRFLRERLLERKATARKREAMERGEEFASSTVEISEHEFKSYVKSLREGQSELNALVRQFLDLPPSPSPSDRASGSTSLRSVYSDQGPPKTHPSAGLSYNRTNSHIQNHPILGPQEHKSPVQGRILQPQNYARQESRAMVGVGGIVTEDTESTVFRMRSYDSKYVPGLGRFAPDIPGGAKLWVQPKQASVDSAGRIKLHYDRAEKNTVTIYEEKLQEEPLPEVTKGYDRRVPDLAPSPRPTAGGRMAYGLDRSGDQALPFGNDVAPDVTQEALLDMMDSLSDRRGQ